MIRRAVWLYDLRLGLLVDGGYHPSVAENSVDEDAGPALCNQELLDKRYGWIDEALMQLKNILTSST